MDVFKEFDCKEMADEKGGILLAVNNKPQNGYWDAHFS